VKDAQKGPSKEEFALRMMEQSTNYAAAWDAQIVSNEEECARRTGRIATIITNLLRLLLMKRLQLFLISALPQLQHSSTGDPLPSYRRSERQTYPNHDNIRLIFALPSMTLGRSCETH